METVGEEPMVSMETIRVEKTSTVTQYLFTFTSSGPQEEGHGGCEFKKKCKTADCIWSKIKNNIL